MSFSLNIRTADQIAEQALAEARATALAQIPQILAQAAEAITGTVPVSEQVSWPVKAAAARAFLWDEATIAQEADLQGEADLTGETIEDLAQAIVTRADAYAQTAAIMSGLRRATTATVIAATTEAEIASAMAGLVAALAGQG